MEVIDTVLTKYAPGDGRRPSKVWDQAGNDYAIWEDMGLFEELKKLIGHPVRLGYESRPSPDGRYQNRSAQAVEQLGGMVAQPVAAPVPAAMPAALPAPMPAPTAHVVIQDVQPIEYQRAKHPDEQKAIRRAVALQCAVTALPNIEGKLTPEEIEIIATRWTQWLAAG